MKVPRGSAVFFAIGAACGNSAAQTAPGAASGFPSHVVRIVLGFAPGGAIDVPARAVSPRLRGLLGQAVMVENRPAVASIVAADMVARSIPDRHTLYLANATQGTPSLFAKLPFDMTRDFAFASLIGMGASALVLQPSVPAKNVGELLGLARAHPGKLNYVLGSTGNITHLQMELLVSMAKINMVRVPYKGGAPSTIATVSGEAQLRFSSVASMLGQIQGRRLRAIAVSISKRSAGLPEGPTVHEAGLPGYDANSRYGSILPAATAPAVLAQLSNDMIRALASGDVKQRLVRRGIVLATGGSEEFRKIRDSGNSQVGAGDTRSKNSVPVKV